MKLIFIASALFVFGSLSNSALAFTNSNNGGAASQEDSKSLSTDISVGFSPYGNALELIVNGIKQTEQEVVVASYSFTSKPISVALLEAHKRGVKVFVVADKKANNGKYTATRFLSNHNIAVCLTDQYATMHHKFMVIDSRTVETGSFNYSAAAVKKNAENVIVIRNADVAKVYRNEFLRLYRECTSYQKQ